jgi:hypothetical protein
MNALSTRKGSGSILRKSGLNSEVIMSLVENAEKILADISKDTNPEDKKQKDELSAR